MSRCQHYDKHEEMIMKKKIAVFLVLCLSICTIGCGKQDGEGQREKKTADDETVAIYAGDQLVYLDEAKYYIYTAQATYETYYLAEGKELDWNSEMSSKVTMKKGVKSLVLDDICKRECMYALAEEYNVKLSEEEKKEIDSEVEQYELQSSKTLKNKINIRKERLKIVFEKKRVARRVEEIMTASNKKLPKETYDNWKAGNTVTATSQWMEIDFGEPIFTPADIRETSLEG